MRYTFNYEVLLNVANRVNVVADKDANILLSFGARDLNENVLCGARITTATEQIATQFTCAKPEGFKEGNELAVSASMFCGIIFNLSSLKSDIYFDIDNGTCLVGIEGKAQVPLPLLTKATDPMKNGETLFNLTLKGSDFLNFLKGGLLFSSETASANGLNNSVIAINTVTGEMTGMSTDKFIIGYSTMTGAMTPSKDAEKEKEAFKAYCEKKSVSPEEVVVLLPRGCVDHLKTLLSGSETFRMRVDETHVMFLVGNSLLYTAVQGATLPMPVNQAKSIMAMEPESRASVDSDDMEKGVSFINSMNELSGKKGPMPVRLSLDNGFIRSESGAAGALKATIKVAASAGECDGLCVNGKFVKTSLSYLRKGGVIVGFVTDKLLLLTLANGNLSEGEDGKAKIAIMGIRDNFEASEDESEEATEEES